MFYTVPFLLLIMLVTKFDAFRLQSAAATGLLTCLGKPAVDVLVKLVDEDDGPSPDDELDSTYTDQDGRFRLSGSVRELTNIDPEIRIFHDCEDSLPCQREWVLGIPDKYISSGKIPKRIMNFGSMNLEIELDNEGRDCFH